MLWVLLKELVDGFLGVPTVWVFMESQEKLMFNYPTFAFLAGTM